MKYFLPDKKYWLKFIVPAPKNIIFSFHNNLTYDEQKIITCTGDYCLCCNFNFSSFGIHSQNGT